jgi:hypothetical protein
MRCRTLAMTPAGVAAVAFEVELAFEGVVDRFDNLAQRSEEPGLRTLRLAAAGGPQQAVAVVGERGLELAAVVVLVCDDDLPSVEWAVRDTLNQYLTLSGQHRLSRRGRLLRLLDQHPDRP